MVYVAAALVAFREGRHALRRGDHQEITVLLFFVPVAFAVLSALVLCPGPHRDWIAASFLSMSLCPYTLALFLLPLFLLKPGPLATKLICGPVLFVGPMYALVLLSAIRELVLPERCPRCRWRRLIPSFHRLLQQRRGYDYRECGVCDAVHLLRSPSSSCPRCGRSTLMRRPYRFAWCASCKRRFKRVWRRPWEDASGADDDRFYWLWDPIGRRDALRSPTRRPPS